MLIQDYLVDAAARFPDRAAVISEDDSISYDRLLSSARGFAAGINEAGMRPGDRVVLYTDNSIAYVIAYFGVLLAGGAVVGQSPGNKERHLRNIINHSEAAGIVAAGRHMQRVFNVAPDCPSLRFIVQDGRIGAPMTAARACLTMLALDELCARGPAPAGPLQQTPDDLAQIIYTSGTTGNPKGVMLSHRNLCANTASIVEYLRLTSSDRVMAVLPFYYSYGNSLLLTHVACGGTVVIDNRFAFPQKVLQRMRDERVTGFAGVPSTFAILVHKAGLKNFSVPSLRYATQAGGAMSPALTKELAEALPGVELFVMYGQTEAAARLSYLEPAMLWRKLGSIGRAIPGVTLSVKAESGARAAPGEVGEIVARGQNVMMGYWRNESETRNVLKEDGLHTGDLAMVDGDGYLYIVARKSDMIKSGAHRISPKEIEELIMEDPRVHEVAVVGEPDPIMGENVIAVVVVRPGAALAENDVLAHCREHLPLYKVPVKVLFRGAMPKTASGKIKKADLRNDLERV